MANSDDSCPNEADVPAEADRDGDCLSDGKDLFPDDPDQGMVRITAGEFWMGSPDGEFGRDSNEARHRVEITSPFLIRATEVTQGQWRAVMGDSPSSYTGDDLPVESVSWPDVVVFCNQLSELEGLTPCYEGASDRVRWVDGCAGYRLPTEAEWEYAARAGTETAFHTGEIVEAGCGRDPALDPAGWYCGNANDGTRPVGQKEANAWGLYDMHGNVWEWVWDAYRRDCEALPASNPRQDAGGDRVIRGGAWNAAAQTCRAAQRSGVGPSYRINYLGFRPARSVFR